MQRLAKLKQILFMKFRATLNFRFYLVIVDRERVGETLMSSLFSIKAYFSVILK